jgi:hypothetical protein
MGFTDESEIASLAIALNLFGPGSGPPTIRLLFRHCILPVTALPGQYARSEPIWIPGSMVANCSDCPGRPRRDVSRFESAADEEIAPIQLVTVRPGALYGREQRGVNPRCLAHRSDCDRAESGARFEAPSAGD